ncbi:hypothetical protein BSL78_18196 [Apostichopus japonicus]|uniref:Uncharacterized protein n=1 Tax=Stichopus japonicus TaxID=307972 RepID=A0A2G8KAC3_STIJA|nr:hypothetical protein BSL78_18196 [Apostichopus japonicus]
MLVAVKQEEGKLTTKGSSGLKRWFLVSLCMVVPMYSSAFSGSYSANNLNNYSSQLVAAPPKSFRPTTSPRRKIVSVSASTSRNSTPSSSYSDPSPNNNSRHSIGRPVSGALKKYPRNRTPKGNVRFSDEVETFHMPPSPDGSMKDVENVAVVPPNQAMNPTRPHGNDFVSHYGSQEHLRSPPHASRTPWHLKRGMRKENLPSQADNTQYEMTTSLGLASTSLNSSGYSSDPSSPVSPPGYQSPRLQAAGDNSSSYQNGVMFGQRSTTPQIMRETSMVKRENSVLAPFCHDCGTQYPTSTSKFCCSCGIQRAFISPR